ncbi:MAG: hypothetical protein K8F91_10350 [Candidatus Obscuribacterales bacterium]|nr:hypothetical protein [Candidatus Obscuribacterales bacterium]
MLRSIPRFRHPDLLASGFFSNFEGPFGLVPVQLVGNLTTGEYVYFRARMRKASLTIFESEEAWLTSDNAIATFEKTYDIEDDIGIGCMDADEAATLVSQWLTLYRSGVTQASCQ